MRSNIDTSVDSAKCSVLIAHISSKHEPVAAKTIETIDDSNILKTTSRRHSQIIFQNIANKVMRLKSIPIASYRITLIVYHMLHGFKLQCGMGLPLMIHYQHGVWQVDIWIVSYKWLSFVLLWGTLEKFMTLQFTLERRRAPPKIVSCHQSRLHQRPVSI